MYCGVGYFNNELTKQNLDFKEAYDVGFSGKFEIDGENQWPQKPDGFRKNVKKYMEEANVLSFKLLDLIAEGLGLEGSSLRSCFDKKTSFLRLNYYPICTSHQVVKEDFGNSEPKLENDGILCINRHTDAGVLTILYHRENDPESLQVYSRHEDKYIRVKPLPGSLTVNLGDVMQVWSNDRYKSALHRVLANSAQVRLKRLDSILKRHGTNLGADLSSILLQPKL